MPRGGGGGGGRGGVCTKGTPHQAKHKTAALDNHSDHQGRSLFMHLLPAGQGVRLGVLLRWRKPQEQV